MTDASRLAELVETWRQAIAEFVAFWLHDDRVVAGMNVNVWDVTDAVKALIRSGRPVDRQRLADPAVPLDAVATLAT